MESLNLPLLGKVGIVTGSGTGIGRAIALRAAKLGADVGVNYHKGEQSARDTSREISSFGRKSLLLPCDVSRASEVRTMVEKVKSEFGRIDFLVNNAGGDGGASSDYSVEDAVVEDWDKIIGANLTGAFLCMKYVTPIMLKAKSGRIVNISSICGVTGDCGPAYCSAKAGMLGLTRSSAATLAPYVQVNAILPGFVQSRQGMHDEAKVEQITPGKKIGSPEDIAEVTTDIIAMKNTFLTGECIVVDGGVTNGSIGLAMNWIAQRV
jgi:3-oxoacyl-[acyl-carrier protein] reductase